MQSKSTIEGKIAVIPAVAALIAALAMALMLTVQITPAFADDSSSSASASSEAASSESASSASSSSSAASSAAANQSPDAALPSPFGGLPLMGNDYVWFGRDLELGGHTIDNDLLAAGQIVRITNCKTGGSIRAAAQEIDVTGSTATENITLAAEHVTIENSTANSVAAVGRAVSFSGKCKELTAYAEKVFIDGTIEGDVAVGATSVEIGTNARIKGTLHVSAASDPVMQRGAEVGDVVYKHSENAGSVGGTTASFSEIESAMSELSSMLLIMMAIIGAIATLIIAVLAEWLFKRQTADAAEMIRTRTGATIGTGIIAAIVAPIAIILLFCLVLTAPVALALTLALLAMTCVAGGFAGASLFKLAFPKLGRFKCALIGGAIVGIASAIPVLGYIVDVVAFMYLLGYVLQSIFLGMRKTAPVNPAPAYEMPMGSAPAYAPYAAQADQYAAPASQAPIAPAAPMPAPAASVAPEAPIAPVSDMPAPSSDAPISETAPMPASESDTTPTQ